MKWPIFKITLNRDEAPVSPERVLELSQSEIEAVRDDIIEIRASLDAVVRRAEANRKAIYRESQADAENNGQGESLVPELIKPPAPEAVKSIRTGDPVPG